ncbi:MAG: hypothetical protein V4678_03365 [Patescibacteria group bacterium]
MSIVERAYNSAFPTAEELWRRNDATHIGDTPVFDIDVDGTPKEYGTRPLYRKDHFRRKKIGSAVLLGYKTTDGVDRLVSVHTLDDAYRSDADMIATTSTAWTTTVGGYAGRRDRRINLEAGIQTVTIGAEGSTNESFLGSDSLATISLAKTAQSEQAILAHASKRFDLPTRHYGLGDSRGAMIKPGHSIYAPHYGNEVIFTDIKAPCVPEKLGPEDLPKVAMWLAMEALGATGVGISLAKDRDLGLLLGTFDTHPRALSTAFGGIMPALMSGEAGRLAELAPNDMQAHVVLYGHDILSSADRWNEIYADKPDVAIKNVPRGSHAHLLGRISLQIDRIIRAEELLSAGLPFDDLYVIRGHKPDIQKQAELRLVVNQ